MRPRRGDRDAPGTRAVSRLGPRATPHTGVRGHCCHRRGWAGPAGSGDTGPAAVLQGGQEAGGDRARGRAPLCHLRPRRGPCRRGPRTYHSPAARGPDPGAVWETRGGRLGGRRPAFQGAAAWDPEDLGRKHLRAAAAGTSPNIEPRAPLHAPPSGSDVAGRHGSGGGAGGRWPRTGSRTGARRGPSAPSTSGLRLRLRAPGQKPEDPPGRRLRPV